MPAKLNSDQVRFWLEEINSCEERKREELLNRNKYPDLIKYYEGEMFDQRAAQTGQKQILASINNYFPNTNAMRSEIMYKNPEIIATATKPEAEENAPIMKSALTYALNKLDALTENKIALFDMLYAGYCGVEVDHLSTKQVIPQAPEKNLLGKAIDGIKKAITGKEAFEKDIAEKVPPKEESYATQDKTYMRRWNPLNFGFDYRAERIKDIRYVYKIIRKTKAEFDAEYPDFADKVTTTGDTLPYSQHTKDEDKKTVTLYEIQLKKKDNQYETILITPSHKFSEIASYDRPYTTNGFNLKIEVLDEYGVLYPISRAKINKANQDDINNYTTFMMEVAERNIPKRGYNKNKLKSPDLEALNNNRVNEAVGVDGGPESIWTIPATNVSLENKELLAIFEKKKEELWGISAARVSGKGDAEFMGELEIQEAGFQERRIDIQEGLRKLMKAEVETIKDIIVQFWDNEIFLKITGEPKPSWYIPEVVTNPQTGEPMVLNPLTEILTMDYEIDIDIVSALKPNQERKKKEEIEYLTWLTNPAMLAFLASHGLTVNPDLIRRSADKFGYSPETVIVPIQPPALPAPEGMPPEAVPEGVVTPEMAGVV